MSSERLHRVQLTGPRRTVVSVSTWLYNRWPAFAAYSVLLLIVGLKFSFYLTSEPLTGWDTQGHWHMARTYWDFFRQGRSLGYDLNWFGGFPAFYFYPPFYYFLLSQIYLLGQSFVTFTFVFNLGIFLIILLFALSIFRLSTLLLRDIVDNKLAYAIALSGTFFYLSYPGSGAQGVSIVGIVQGTFISAFGHSLILWAFFYLERHRRTGSYLDLGKFICCYTLLFYTHYLSTVFLTFLLVVYALFFFRDFNLKSRLLAIGIPFVMFLPGLYLFICYSAFSSAHAMDAYYPALLSIAGKDWFTNVSGNALLDLKGLLNELFIRLKIINLLFICLFPASIYLVVRRKLPTPLSGFCLTAAICFFTGAMDNSLTYFFPNLAVHWYRAFELFLVLFTLLTLSALAYGITLLKNPVHRYALSIVLLTLIGVKLIAWDPVKHESLISLEAGDYLHKLEDTEPLQKYLAGLPPSSLILPEITMQTALGGSPHWLNPLILQAGHRNALGLMIESSLSPLLLHGYLPETFKQFFVWGIDVSWKNMLYQTLLPESRMYQQAFPDFLRRSGIHYIIAVSTEMDAYLTRYPLDFQPTFAAPHVRVYRVLEARGPINQLSGKPVGFLYLAALQAQPLSSRETFRQFLLHANQVRLVTGIREADIINLNPLVLKDGSFSGDTLKSLCSALIIFNANPQSALPPHEAIHWAGADFPLLLVNFTPNPALKANLAYLSTRAPAPTPALSPANLPDNLSADSGAFSPVEPEEFSSVRLQYTVSSATASSSAAAELPVHLALSYFPDWQGKNGERIFQTDTNQLLVYPRAQKNELVFIQPLAWFLTCWFYVLLLVSGVVWMSGLFRKVKRLRTG